MENDTEPPTPSVVYLNLERTEYELCGLVRLLIMGKQTLKNEYNNPNMTYYKSVEIRKIIRWNIDLQVWV